MKNVILAAAIAATTSVCFGDNPVQGGPTGSLEIDRSVVRSGSTPTVKWNITFPPSLPDTVCINGEPGGTTLVNTGGTIETKSRVRVEVYMVGTAVSLGRRDADGRPYRLDTFTEVNLGDSWLPLYRGNGRDINSTVPVISQIVPAGTEIAIRSQILGGRTPFGVFRRGTRYTSESPNMLIMTDGAVPTSRQGGSGDTSLEDYVRPYLAEDGSFDLGEADMMVAAELTHTQSQIAQAGYDSNDSVVLIRFVEAD